MEPTVVVVAAPESSLVEAVFVAPPVAAAIILFSALAVVELAPAAIVDPGVLVAASQLVVRPGETATNRSVLEW